MWRWPQLSCTAIRAFRVQGPYIQYVVVNVHVANFLYKLLACSSNCCNCTFQSFEVGQAPKRRPQPLRHTLTTVLLAVTRRKHIRTRRRQQFTTQNTHFPHPGHRKLIWKVCGECARTPKTTSKRFACKHTAGNQFGLCKRPCTNINDTTKHDVTRPTYTLGWLLSVLWRFLSGTAGLQPDSPKTRNNNNTMQTRRRVHCKVSSICTKHLTWVQNTTN